MRSIRKVLQISLTVLAVAALTPALASAAEWKKEGIPLGYETATPAFLDEGIPLAAESSPVTLNGTFKIWGIGGWEECSLAAKATLGPNGTGQISEASVSAASCKVGGGVSGCKVDSVTTTNIPWPLYAGEVKIATGMAMTFNFSGMFCGYETKTVSGGFTATPDSTQAMSSWSLSGFLKEKFGWKEHGWEEAETTVSGSLKLSPAGRYGVGMKGDIGLSGSLKWSSPFGSIECSSTSFLALQPGNSGAMTPLSWGAKPSCSTGGYLASCTVTSAKSTGTPGPVTDEGTQIKLSKVAFKWNLSGSKCPYTYMEAEGALTGVPDKTSAISSMVLSGALSMKYTGGETGEANWSGTYSWSPAGVFGL